MPRDFRVVALLAAYNEADVIAPVISSLIENGIDVYVLDHGSTDGTADAVRPFLGHGVIDIESFTGGAEGFSWTAILERKQQLAATLDADWFIHHDADEFREGIWDDLVLRHAIERVDRLGYNAIDFQVFTFWPTDESFLPGQDPREAFRFFEPGQPWDKQQVKCWRRTPSLPDLVSSGGHDVMFPGRSVFPVRFLLRHYPIRSQAHGERKVFQERRPRFQPDELARGWHVQYDEFPQGTQFVKDPSTLTEFDPEAAKLFVMTNHRGVDDLREALDRQAATLARREESLSALRSELDRALGQVEDQRAEAERRQEALHHAAEDLSRHRDEVTRLRHQIDALHASKSWRWMAPLRALYRALGRS